MFLKLARSPARPTILVDILAASWVVRPILVPISPNIAAISRAVPCAIPNCVRVVLVNSLTSALLCLKETSTLLRLSSKSLASLIAAPPAAAIGSVSFKLKSLPTFVSLLEKPPSCLLALFKLFVNLLVSACKITRSLFSGIAKIYSCKITKFLALTFYQTLRRF